MGNVGRFEEEMIERWLTMFTTMIRNQWLTSLIGMFFLDERNGIRSGRKMRYQMIFFGLGAKLTFHSWTPSVLLREVFGRRSDVKHVGRKFERTLKSKKFTKQNPTNPILPMCFFRCCKREKCQSTFLLSDMHIFIFHPLLISIVQFLVIFHCIDLWEWTIQHSFSLHSIQRTSSAQH